MANPPPKSRLRKVISDRGVYAQATKLATQFGGAKRLDTSQGDIFKQGIGEVGAELGNRIGDPSRNRELLASIKRRTSATSKQRALNRLLARYGSTTGSSGTTVNPRRLP